MIDTHYCYNSSCTWGASHNWAPREVRVMIVMVQWTRSATHVYNTQLHSLSLSLPAAPYKAQTLEIIAIIIIITHSAIHSHVQNKKRISWGEGGYYIHVHGSHDIHTLQTLT